MTYRAIRPRWLVLGAGVTAAALTAWAVSEPEDRSEPQAAPAAGAAGERAAWPQPCRFAQGNHGAYSIDSNVRLKVNPAALLGAATAGEAGITRDVETSLFLHWKVLRQERGQWLMAGAITNLVESGGAVDRAPRPDADELRRPFLFRVRPTCEVVDFGFADDTSDLARLRISTLLLWLDLRLPAKAKRQPWIRSQFDGTGQYLASYQPQWPAAPARMIKQVNAYSRLWEQGPKGRGRIAAEILGSQAVVDFGGRGRWLEAIDGTHHHVLAQGTGRRRVQLADVKHKLKLRVVVPTGDPLDDVNADARLYQWRAPSDPPPQPAVAKRYDHGLDEGMIAALAGITLEDTLARFASLRRDGEGGEVRRAALLLAASLRANPAMAMALIRELLEEGIDRDLQATVFLGLELAGTPEAHQALISAVGERKLDTLNRARAAAALAEVPNPSPATLDALVAASKEDVPEGGDNTVVQTSTYAIGILEDQAREKNPELAALVRNELRSRLVEPGDNGALRRALDAVSNSGSVELLDDVAAHLSSPDPLVRSHAIDAMRRMPPGATAEYFSQLIGKEGDSGIRTKLAEMYTRQARHAGISPLPDLVAAAIRALGIEPDPRTRGALIALIGAAAGDSLEAWAALAAHFEVETDVALLKRIGRYVAARELPERGIP